MKNGSLSDYLKKHSTYYLYGLGEFGFTFFLSFISYHLLYFLTDVLAWPGATSAIVYTTIQWFEGITSILMGLFVEQVNLKWGKYRPWMIIGSLGCGIFTILFFVDWNGPLWIEVAAFCLFYLLAYTSYNLMWVAYRSMVGVASVNAKDNVSYTSCAAQLGGVSSLIYSAVGGLLLHAFADIRYGYLLSAAMCAVMMFAGQCVSSHVTKPFDNRNTKRVDAEKKTSHKLDFQYIKTCLSRPLISFFIGNALRCSNFVILQSLLVYYFTYVMENSNGLSIYITLMALTVIIGQIPANALARKFGKTVMYEVSAVISVLSIISLNFIGTNMTAFKLITILNSFANIFAGSMIPSYINEIADYTEYEKNIDARSFIVSIGGTANKVASIIGGAFASFGLNVIGYSSSVTASPELGIAITRLISISSALCVGIGAIAFLFYPLTDKKMKAIYDMKEARLIASQK